ncbi:MAG: FecR domain-containing protein [Acidobacteriota bacterium]
MKLYKNDPDDVLDQVMGEIREEEVEGALVEQAARRVWGRLQLDPPETSSCEEGARADQHTGIRSCSDVRALIPTYLSGRLPESRKLLFQDHLSDCMDCRKALQMAQSGPSETPIPRPAPKASQGGSRRALIGWGIAAALLLGVGLFQFGALDSLLPAPDAARAVVTSVEGSLWRVDAGGNTPLPVGAEIHENEEIRTAKGSHAVVELADGSRVEVSDRAQLFVTARRAGKTVHLSRGSIIVEAAPQRDGYLYVATGDCLVSVKGTIFSVSHGTKGSRVSVIEGEVVVEQGRETSTLHPGEQISTSHSLAAVSVAQDISWSPNASRHLALMRELASLQKELEVRLDPGLRYSTALLDLAPEATVIYLSLPNLSTSLSEAHHLFQERLHQSPVLQQWWNEQGAQLEPTIEQILTRLRDFGEHLGEEVAIAIKVDQKSGPPTGAVLLTEVVDEGGFTDLLREEIDRINSDVQAPLTFRIIEDPLAESESSSAGVEIIYVMVQDVILAISPSLECLRQVATDLQSGTSAFIDTPFHSRIAQAYQEGVGYLLAADLRRLIEQEVLAHLGKQPIQEREAFRRLGILDAEQLVVERKASGDATETRAVVSFEDSRSGLVSWLAEPAPIGALDFVSPDAHVVAAFAVKDPALMVEDLFQFLQALDSKAWQNLVDFQIDKGINIERDFAAPLGGEVVFAVDGPVLPTSSWKLVFEVYDPAQLQETIQWIVEEINQQASEGGGTGFELSREQAGGRVFFRLSSPDSKMEVHYVFADGYLIAAPSRALLENAMAYRQTGYVFATSAGFTALLPQDGHVNFSAFVYQNVGSLLQPLARHLPQAPAPDSEEGQSLSQLAEQVTPTLLYAYGEPNQILLAGRGDGISGLGIAGMLASIHQMGIPALSGHPSRRAPRQ